jgi:hypothetical protein
MALDYLSLIALGLSVLLGLIHYLGESLKIAKGGNQYRIISFAAGISIGYLFLDLLPLTYNAADHLKKSTFIFLLLGFIAVHLTEKYFYQHARGDRLFIQLHVIHFVTFFMYYFIVGCVLVDLIHQEMYQGILFIIPVSLHAGLSTASLSDIHSRFIAHLPEKILLAMAPILGSIMAALVKFPPVVHGIFISGISGVLLYVFVKEFLPDREKGKPLFFLVGVAVFWAIMFVITRLFH